MEGAEPPFEWLVSRVCEEYGCLPSEALRELLDEPRGMALDIMELRAYARTKAQMDAAKSEKEMPTGPMVEWVWLVTNELLQRKRR